MWVKSAVIREPFSKQFISSNLKRCSNFDGHFLLNNYHIGSHISIYHGSWFIWRDVYNAVECRYSVVKHSMALYLKISIVMGQTMHQRLYPQKSSYISPLRVRYFFYDDLGENWPLYNGNALWPGGISVCYVREIGIFTTVWFWAPTFNKWVPNSKQCIFLSLSC